MTNTLKSIVQEDWFPQKDRRLENPSPTETAIDNLKPFIREVRFHLSTKVYEIPCIQGGLLFFSSHPSELSFQYLEGADSGYIDAVKEILRDAGMIGGISQNRQIWDPARIELDY